MTGPITHYLYQFLEGVVPKASNFSSLKKAILDRVLFAPPYLLALFYSVAIMEVNVRRICQFALRLAKCLFLKVVWCQLYMGVPRW